MDILKLGIVITFGQICFSQVIPQVQPVPVPTPAPTGNKPGRFLWVGQYSPDRPRSGLGLWLLTGNTNQYHGKEEVEYEGYDGWYNNIAHPDLGAIDRPLLRRWPAAYEDGSYEPSGKNRPNPLTLSDELLEGVIGSKSTTGKNALLVFFGQQVVEEVLDAQRPACPPEYFNIEIPEGHRYRTENKHTVLPFLRTRYDMSTGYSPNNPRQQLNEITPYIDGGLVYGTTKAWADYLRTYENGTVDPDGKLASSHGGLFPEYNTARLPMANPPPPVNHSTFIHNHELFGVSRFFRLGNPRGNENTFLLTFGVLWFRWHNYIAENLKLLNPTWSGDKLFNEARKWVIATQQQITIYRWLPKWLGTGLDTYRKYDPAIDPQIDQFFQSAAMRFGHTLVVPGVYLRDYGRNGCRNEFNTWPKRAVRTCNSFWRPQDAMLTRYNDDEIMDIDRLLMGMSVQLCEKEDHKIVEDLRGNVFGPLEFSRRDLMALNIQRARDHGLPDFNTARRAYNLPAVNTTSHFIHVSDEILQRFQRLYNNSWNNIDIWIGGIMETGDAPGQLFQEVIKDQFRRIRDGDRFWFENPNGGFTPAEIGRIKQLDIYEIIMAVTKMDQNDIPQDPFGVPERMDEVNLNCSQFLESTTVSGKVYYHLPQLNATILQENCTESGTYDYFYNSEASFILSFAFMAALIAGTFGLVWFLSRRQTMINASENSKMERAVRETFKKERIIDMPYPVKEWSGFKNSLGSIVVILNKEKKQIQVNTHKGKLLRGIDLSISNKLDVYIASDRLHLMLRMIHEYDLVLKFESEFLRENFLDALERFTEETGVTRQRIHMAIGPMLKQAVTKLDRQNQLDKFFRVVFAQAFKIEHSDDELLHVDKKSAKEVIYTELTINEFAEALAMKADSEFVRRIFSLIDKDKNGFVSFREFLDLLFIFAKGSAKTKAKLLFDMYDINRTGILTEGDFRNMIRSLMETVHASVSQDDLDKTINTLKHDVRMTNRNEMSFDDFFNIFADEINKVGDVNIEFANVGREHRSYLGQALDTVESLYMDPSELQNRVGGSNSNEAHIIDEEQEREMTKVPSQEPVGHMYALSRYIETNMRELFWVVAYTLVLIAIFAERAYYYSVEREHSGLRQIAGYGVTITRGAASAMMFTYSSLLVTMCRNTITLLRDTFANTLLPFDSYVEMHKYIACWALFFTVMHIIGHAFNFYHISTQTADDLTCLFRNFFHATHELPKFHYWCWQTMTGFTGVVLTIIGAMIYITAMPGVSRNLFWRGHALYPLFFIFMVLHGTGRLIQPPFFPYFLIGPLILFIIDSLISASRKKIEIRVLNAELLPSGVTKLEFKRPSNFEYKSGQWVQIACLALNPSEFHPFTLSSSPNESNLSVHIRAVGPWTNSIRSLYDPNLLRDNPFPKLIFYVITRFNFIAGIVKITKEITKIVRDMQDKWPSANSLAMQTFLHQLITTIVPTHAQYLKWYQIHLDGPYGEGHQDWYRFEVSVLVGGGIGVTPFASILKDIVFRANSEHKNNCKKVYFVWVTKTQRQFEWLVDIIREVEMSDVTQTVSVHLFITQFYHKFDLRTTLLYICELHFQRVSGKSLFTGLKAVTHFGRPTFPQFFKSLQSLHPDVKSFGVFSCGPPPMTASVERACVQVNKSTTETTTFQHHYKNF